MLAIPADAKHPEDAHAFINYLMDPQVAANNSNFVNYANGNAASLPMVNEEVKNDPGIYPTPEVKAKLFTVLAYNEDFHAADDAHVDEIQDRTVTGANRRTGDAARRGAGAATQQENMGACPPARALSRSLPPGTIRRPSPTSRSSASPRSSATSSPSTTFR